MLGLAVVTALLCWGGWKCWELRHYRRAMARIEAEMDQGLNTLAARDLAALLARNPESGEAAYWLGACEKMRPAPSGGRSLVDGFAKFLVLAASDRRPDGRRDRGRPAC